MPNRYFTTILVIALTCFCGSLLAATLRVNNTLITDKVKKVYASLQEAHNDAATKSGDTLLVEGSTKEYTELTCTKKLVIIGPGYFLAQNGSLQANSISATVQSISFKSGAEGSVIIGLLFSSNLTGYGPRVFVNGITVMRCYLANGIYIENSLNSLIMLGNYIARYSFTVASTNTTYSGIVLKNNIWEDGLSIARYTNTPRVFATVEHNVFLSDIVVEATSFRSNVIVSSNGSVDILSGAILGNLSKGSQLSAYPGNTVYKDGQLFAGLTAAGKSPDGQYKVKSDSPFLKSGYNGEEPGVFGGSEPYILSGIPPIPSIYELHADAIANKQDGLKVTIKVRANQ